MNAAKNTVDTTSPTCPTPLISVIIPAYQQPDFLNEALESVARQTYPAIEIIVVDDASGKEFTDRYRVPPNGQLIFHEVRQAKAAISRNRAVREARGTYIALLDQDDIWLPQKLEVQVKALEQHPKAMLHFVEFEAVDASLNKLPRQPRPRTLKDPLAAFLYANWINPSQVMLRRTLFDRIGPFDENIRGASDWDMWLRTAALGNNAVICDSHPLTRYRYHPAQWSKADLMMLKGCDAVISKTAEWLPQKRPDLIRLLHRRQAKWLRDLAQVRLETRTELDQVWPSLRNAWRNWPLDWKIYRCMVRALLTGTRPH